jgi:hypothetical protein
VSSKCKGKGKVATPDVEALGSTETYQYQDIRLEFPEKPDVDILIYTRLKDDLPPYLKGTARWYSAKDTAKSAYTIKGTGGGLILVEYINGTWYQLYQHGRQFKVSREDILNPTEHGLGMVTLPYEPREPPPEQPDTVKASIVPSEHSTKDTPVVSRAQA